MCELTFAFFVHSCFSVRIFSVVVAVGRHNYFHFGWSQMLTQTLMEWSGLEWIDDVCKCAAVPRFLHEHTLTLSMCGCV